jgi:hypothetical protein
MYKKKSSDVGYEKDCRGMLEHCELEHRKSWLSEDVRHRIERDGMRLMRRKNRKCGVVARDSLVMASGLAQHI